MGHGRSCPKSLRAKNLRTVRMFRPRGFPVERFHRPGNAAADDFHGIRTIRFQTAYINLQRAVALKPSGDRTLWTDQSLCRSRLGRVPTARLGSLSSSALPTPLGCARCLCGPGGLGTPPARSPSRCGSDGRCSGGWRSCDPGSPPVARTERLGNRSHSTWLTSQGPVFLAKASDSWLAILGRRATLALLGIETHIPEI